MENEQKRKTMNEILNAINETGKNSIKKRETKLVSKDIFSYLPENKTFDIIDKVKPRKHRSEDINKWSNKDFLGYMRDNIKNSLIRLATYDIICLKRVEDNITKGIRDITNDKDKCCDNRILKNYLDWWLSANPVHGKVVSTESFCNEKSVRDFFKTDLWMPVEKPQTLQGLVQTKKPSKQTYVELYSNGGLKKLIYGAGIIESYIFLLKQKTKEEAIREIKKALLSLHESVFQHVVEKTIKSAPYDIKYKFDVKSIIKAGAIKFGLIPLLNLNYDNLFSEKQ